MKVKLILPALTEAKSPYWRSIKYSLFPPLGLATLAAYVHEDDDVVLEDEHVQQLDLSDQPDLVAIQVYITSAYRAYEIADHYRRRGAHVCLGGIHVTALPSEALRHADTIFLGPGEDTWPAFLRDFRAGRPKRAYRSRLRTLVGHRPARRDVIERRLYLVPNSMVASRGCPHSCDFCYKTAFFRGGHAYYTRAVEDVLAEVESLPGRHLYFLDDNLFGRPAFARELFAGMRGMGRLWQAGGTVEAILVSGLMEQAAEAGLRSLFVGFETLSPENLCDQHKHHNLHHNYAEAIRRLHDLGVMINASFVFGMDADDESVFERTVEWAIGQGIETATFHILTPYPGTPLHARLAAQGRITTANWDLYDTRHAVFRPARMSAQALEDGYWRAYRDFYRWGSIFTSAWAKPQWSERLRHTAYTGAWRRCESVWDLVIRARVVQTAVPLLESVLGAFGTRAARRAPTPEERLSASRLTCADAT